MELVTVKRKFQVVIPASLRKLGILREGDLLEARLENGKYTFTPKSVIDRGIAESMEDFRRGRFIGPFSSAKEAMKALRAKAKK